MLNRIKQVLNEFEFGRLLIAVRRDTPGNAGELNGQLGPLTLDGSGRLRVNSDLVIDTLTITNVKSTEPSPGTINTTRPATAATTGTLLAATAGAADRRGFSIFNEAAVPLYIKYGATASLTDFQVKIAAGALYEDPWRYNGRVDGILESGAGSHAQVLEVLP